MSEDAGREGSVKTGLDSPRFGRRAYAVLCVICGGLLVADLLYHKHVHYDFEGWWGFFGFFGFVSAVALVVAAKWLRKILMRPEDYYE
ncbi:MAG: hypothetical protein R3266_08400 [Gemmatimonadota bacterium]|nr:hypothetical protein [Gemmatimonadota bacterium]